MAFAYTVNGAGKFEFTGQLKRITGTFTNGAGDEGGDIVTGLNSVKFFSIQQTGAAVTTGAPVVNESFPTATGTMTIVTDANADGIWEAVGE